MYVCIYIYIVERSDHAAIHYNVRTRMHACMHVHPCKYLATIMMSLCRLWKGRVTLLYVRTRIHACFVHAYTHTHVYTQIHLHAYTHRFIHAYTHTCTRRYTYMHTHAAARSPASLARGTPLRLGTACSAL